MDIRIGPYLLQAPESAQVSHHDQEVAMLSRTFRHWLIEERGVRISAHLEEKQEPASLADFILNCTKRRVTPDEVTLNGIRGVRYGSYSTERSWIDWWMKEGDQMICLNLQSWGMPSEDLKQKMEAVIHSLRLSPS